MVKARNAPLYIILRWSTYIDFEAVVIVCTSTGQVDRDSLFMTFGTTKGNVTTRFGLCLLLDLLMLYYFRLGSHASIVSLSVSQYHRRRCYDFNLLINDLLLIRVFEVSESETRKSKINGGSKLLVKESIDEN